MPKLALEIHYRDMALLRPCPGLLTARQFAKTHIAIKTFSTIVSVLFHPLLMVTYMLAMLLLVNPYQFGVNAISGQGRLLLLVFLSTFAMPALALFLMRSLNMVSSLSLDDRHERIGPYLITGVFYMWMFINFKNNQSIPFSLTVATLGATVGLFTAFFFNNFTKISAHAVGIGGMLGLAALNSMRLSFDTFAVDVPFFGALEVSTNFVFVVVVLLAGLVCTARLYLKAHTPSQVYGGLAVGFAAQFVAFWYLQWANS